MRKLKVITRKIMSWQSVLLTVVISTVILSAFFVANNLVINETEVEAAAGANYSGNCGTKNTSTGAAVADITFTYTHGSNGSVVVKGNGKTVINKGNTSTNNTFVKLASTVNNYTELVNCSYRFENVVFSGDCSSFFTSCKKMSSITFVNCNFSAVTSCKTMFSGCGNLSSIDMSGISFDNCTSFESMFANTSYLSTANFKNVYMGMSSTCKNMFQNSGVKNAYFDGATISNKSTASSRVLSYMFTGCPNLEKATFTGASISNVTAMDHMFNECNSLISADFKGMDMSSCTTFADMFYNCYNMSTVTFAGASMGNGATASTTKEMFKACEGLTSANFSNTNMLSVTDMSYMFQNCYELMYAYFDGTRLNNVTTMAYMFNNCKSLYKFEMKATSESLQALTTMTHMFDYAVDIYYFEMQNFNLAKLSNMEYMFANTDIQSVSFYHNTFGVSFSCANMFKECWYLSTVDFSYCTFTKKTGFADSWLFNSNPYINEVDFSNCTFTALTSFKNMFKGCTELSYVYFDYSNFPALVGSNSDGSLVVDMFNGCNRLYEVSMTHCKFPKLKTLEKIFNGSIGPSWFDMSYSETPSLTLTRNMFLNCSNLTNCYFGEYGYTSSFVNFANVTDASYMFSGCSNLSYVELYGTDWSACKTFAYMFQNCKTMNYVGFEKVKTSTALTNMSYMFTNCEYLDDVDLSSLTVSSVTTIAYMFQNCKWLETFEMPGGFSKLTTMAYFCDGCEELSDESFWLPTSDVLTTAANAYSGCTSFKFVYWSHSIGAKAKSFANFFFGCTNLELVVWNKNANMSETNNITSMFEGCTSMRVLDLSNWYISASTTGTRVFANMPSLEYLNINCMNWNKVSTSQMFYGTNNIKIIECPRTLANTTTRLDLMADGKTSAGNTYYLITEFTSASASGTSTHWGRADTNTYNTVRTDTYGLGFSIMVTTSFNYLGDPSNGTNRDPGYNQWLKQAYEGDPIPWIYYGNNGTISYMLDNGQIITGLNMNLRYYKYSEPVLAATVVTVVVDPRYLFPSDAYKVSDYSLKQNTDVIGQVSINSFLDVSPHKLKCVINIPWCSKGYFIKSNTPSQTYNSFPNKGPFKFNGKNQSLGTPTATDERRWLTFGTDFYIGIRTGSTNSGNFYIQFSGNTPYVRNAGTHFVNFVGKGNYSGSAYETVTVNKASISNSGSGMDYKGHLSLNLSSLVYDRAKHTPSVSAYDDSNDYTIDSEDFSINVVSGTDVGTYTSTATSTNRNYTSGSALSGSFTITQKPISDSNVTVTSQSASLEWTGKSLLDTYKNNLNFSYAGVTMNKSTEYTVTPVSGYDMTSIGTQKVTVTGIGNFKGSREMSFTITPAYVNNDMITLNESTFTYDGLDHKPTISVYDARLAYALVKDQDYTIEYLNYNNAGTGTVKITGKGRYQGIAQKNYTINKFDISSEEIKFVTSKTYKFGDVPVAADFTLSDEREDSAYTFSNNDLTYEITGYENHGNATIKATVKSLTNYAGTRTMTVPIAPREISAANYEYTGPTVYTGFDTKETFDTLIKLTFLDKVLIQNTDYEIIYPDDMTTYGDKEITIKGLGNFDNEIKKTISISPKALSNDMMTLDIMEYIYDKTEHKPVPTLKDASRADAVLVLDSDYNNITYENNVDAGTARVTVYGIGNYEGSCFVDFTINPYDISNEDITLVATREFEFTFPVPTEADYVITDTRATVGDVLPNDWFDFEFTNVDYVGTGGLVVKPKVTTTNYVGSKSMDVVIEPVKITDPRVKVSIPMNMEREYEDMSDIIEPLIVVTFNETTLLVNGTDYTVKFLSDMKSAGDKQVEITGIGGFRNTRVDDFTMKDDNPELLKITAKDGTYRPNDEIEFDFEWSENIFVNDDIRFTDITLKPNVGQIEIGGNVMKLRFVPNSVLGHNFKMTYKVKEGDELLKGLDAYSSGWGNSDAINDVSGNIPVSDSLLKTVKNPNIKIVTDHATITIIQNGINAKNVNTIITALADYDRMSFLIEGETGLIDRMIITENDPQEVKKLMLINYLGMYVGETTLEGETQAEVKADIIKTLKDGVELYDVEQILKSEKTKFDNALSNSSSYQDVQKVYDLVHPLNDEQKTIMNHDFDNLVIYSYTACEAANINSDKSADERKQKSRDFIEDKVIFDKILNSSEKLSDDEKKYIKEKYIDEGDDAVKERVLQRILLYLSDEKIKGGSQNENKEIILRDIYNGIWVDEVEQGLYKEIDLEKPDYDWVKLLDMLEVLYPDIQFKVDKDLRTFIQDGYLNWRLDQIIKGNTDDPRDPDPSKPDKPDKPVDPKNVDPKEKKEAIIKALDDDGIIKRLLELSNLTDDEKKTILDYILVLDSDVTDEDKEKKKENREKFLEYLADTAMGFDSIQDALPALAKAIDDFYKVVEARIKIDELLKKMADDPGSVSWDDILKLLDSLTDKQKEYLPDKFVEDLKKTYEDFIKGSDIKITQSGDPAGSDINIYGIIDNLDIQPGDKPSILINILNDIKNLNELRKLLVSDEVQTKLSSSDKTSQDERVAAGFEFKVVDQSDPKKIIPLKDGTKVEIVFTLPDIFAGKTVYFYTIADDGTVKKEAVTMGSAVDGVCRASILTDKYGKFVVTHNYVETIIRIKSNNGGPTGSVTKSTKKPTDLICIPHGTNTVTVIKVYTYELDTGEYKEDTKLGDTLHYPTYQIYESHEVPKGSIIEIEFMTQSSGKKKVKELPSSRRFTGYMKGKENNMFKPNDGLTRAETAVLVSRIISDDKESYEAQGKKWAKKGIENVIAKEIMSNDKNGDFRENDIITRGEFAKVIYKIIEDDIDTELITKKFVDTEGKFYEDYANILLSNGLIKGFADGEFKGDLGLTRSEACVMINAATGRSDIADELLMDNPRDESFLEYIDVEDFRWFYKDVTLASNDFEIPNKYYEAQQAEKENNKK